MTKYCVTFDRIGRTHSVVPLIVEVDGPNHLADQIYAYARPYLISRNVEVSVDMDTMKGHVFCGFQVGSSFRIVEVADYTDPPKFPEGTPEYEAYVAELREELDKFAHGEVT